jgi:hypothetical protein
MFEAFKLTITYLMFVLTELAQILQRV